MEALDIAYAVQENLDHDFEVSVWSQGVFEPSRTTIETLERELGGFDFALFVFSPDDIVRMRGREYQAVRDNIIFELGLAIGKLSRDRSFFVLPRDTRAFRLPTDLLGVTPVTYNPSRADGNHAAALGPACSQLRRAMKTLGAKQVASRSIAAPVATGLSEELRQELAQLFVEHNSRIEGVFKTFESNLSGVMGTQHRIDRATEPIQELRELAEAILSIEARALMRGILGGHIAAAEYQLLAKSKVGGAIKELRSLGFLVPLRGRSEYGKQVNVYWFPPGLSAVLQEIAGSIQTTGLARRRANAALAAAGYLPFDERLARRR